MLFMRCDIKTFLHQLLDMVDGKNGTVAMGGEIIHRTDRTRER